jgi:hypothetical protein
MKNFMASTSLSQGMELDEVPNEGDMMPLPREDAIMMIYDGHPLPGMRHMSDPSPEPQLIATGAAGTQGCKDTNFLMSLYINVCWNIDMYIIATLKAKENTTNGIIGGHGDTGRAKF